MPQNYKLLISLVLMGFSFVLCGSEAKSKVQGDPTQLWLSPLEDEDIEDTAYNRCRIIRVMKPGIGQAGETTRNTYDTLSKYVSDLYAQSVKISAYIGQEEDEAATLSDSSADLTNEIALIEEGIVNNLADISRRMNIINSFEAGILMLDSLEELKNSAPGLYAEFRALQDGKYEYVSDCKVLLSGAGEK